jgi:hypothetical protein
MEKVGCLNYSYTPWESEKGDVYDRQIYYRFDKHISRYRGEVTSFQQKSPLSDKNGWLIEEVMTLHGVPLGDYFNVWLKPLNVSFAIVFPARLIFSFSCVGNIELSFFFCSFTLDTKLRIYPQNRWDVMYRYSLGLGG